MALLEQCDEAMPVFSRGEFGVAKLKVVLAAARALRRATRVAQATADQISGPAPEEEKVEGWKLKVERK